MWHVVMLASMVAVVVAEVAAATAVAATSILHKQPGGMTPVKLHSNMVPSTTRLQKVGSVGSPKDGTLMVTVQAKLVSANGSRLGQYTSRRSLTWI